MRNYIRELLLEDNFSMSDETIKYYIDEILKELKFCGITQKSVNEISLHEFRRCDKNYKGIWIKYCSLLVTVTYNGDFVHSFDVYREEK